jgi:hypothetical protein
LFGQSLALQIEMRDSVPLMVAARFDKRSRKRVERQLKRFREDVERCKGTGATIVVTQSVGERAWGNKIHKGGKLADELWTGVVRASPEFVTIQMPAGRDGGR